MISHRPTKPNGKEIADVGIQYDLPSGYQGYMNIEVKTWKSYQWASKGRCIETYHWQHYHNTHQLIVWMLVEESQDPNKVPTKCTIAGWNLTTDFPNKVVYTGSKGVANY